MEAARYLSDCAVIKQNQALQHLLNNAPESATQKYHLDNLKTASENRIDSFKNKLKQKFKDFVEPSYTVLACISNYESAKLQIQEEERQMEIYVGARRNNFANPVASRVLINLDKPYVEMSNAFYPIDYNTGIASVHPLLNPSPPKWEDIESYVLVLSSTSKVVHTIDTISNLIDYARDKGISKMDLGTLMKAFVQNYLPHLSGAIFMNTDTDVIFERILNSVNFYNLTQNVRQAIMKLSRAPHEGLSEVLDAYISLLCELAFLESPDMNEEKAVKKATKEAMRHAKYFVHPNVAFEIDELRKQKMTRLDEELTMEELCQFVTRMEIKKENRLTTSSSFTGNNISLSIFHTQYQQASTAQLNSKNYEQTSRPSSPNIYANADVYRPSTPNIYANADAYTYDNVKPNASSTPGGKYGAKPKPSNNFYNNDRAKSPTHAARYDRSKSPTTRRNPEKKTYQTNGKSTVWIRSNSGNNMTRVNTNRILSRSPSATQKNTRPSSNTRNRSSSNSRVAPDQGMRRRNSSTKGMGRRNSYSDKDPKKNKARSQSPSNRCKLCGGTHPTPNDRNKQLCPVYGKGPQTRHPCNNCKKGLYHPHFACQHGNPVRLSRSNSPSNFYVETENNQSEN